VTGDQEAYDALTGPCPSGLAGVLETLPRLAEKGTLPLSARHRLIEAARCVIVRVGAPAPAAGADAPRR